jgi:LmbE family N-acetylglucosaminyl deacetylase
MKTLYIFVAHLDDVEISTYGYIFKHREEYNHIKFVIATTWKSKITPWDTNFKIISNLLGDHIKITYSNLEFPQRKLNSYMDDCKDKFYSLIDYTQPFDILTHDSNDAHTDHVVISSISRGLHKLCNRYVTIYSPSSINFNCNYYIPLNREVIKLKTDAMNQYDHSEEQSYTGNDYYFKQDWEKDNVPRARVLENYSTSLNKERCEIYNIIKWV